MKAILMILWAIVLFIVGLYILINSNNKLFEAAGYLSLLGVTLIALELIFNPKIKFKK